MPANPTDVETATLIRLAAERAAAGERISGKFAKALAEVLLKAERDTLRDEVEKLRNEHPGTVRLRALEEMMRNDPELELKKGTPK